MAKAAKKVTVQRAAGTAGGGGNDLSATGIQDAMDAAARALAAKGVTDPDEIRDAKLAARAKFTADARALAAKEAKSGTRR